MVHNNSPIENHFLLDKYFNVRIEKLNIDIDVFNTKSGVLDPNELLTLKCSHSIVHDFQLSKHLWDIDFLVRHGATINYEMFTKLYLYWKEFYKNHRSNLKLSSKEFFNNAISCPYNHDYLHTLINPNPIYKKILIGEVEPSEEKFNLLTHQEKLDLVREEIYVMGYERMGNRNYRETYNWMLNKFIINHAPFYEALFIVLNHRELCKPLINYKKKIEDGLSRIS
jgi:hypothetical protein